MSFDGFIGNGKIKQQLAYLVSSGRLPHAIVFEGEEGIGKRTLAKELALNLFCKDENNRPCGECAQCIKVQKDIHLDIFYYKAPDRARSFSVKTVREIIEDVYIRPNEADYKIYILGNCQNMAPPAQNALLKVLEEPPSYAVFILCVTNKSTLLETVLSRSVVFTLEGVDLKEGAEFIDIHYEDIDYDEAYSSLELSGGNIGRAVQSLKDGELAEYSLIADNIALALLADNEYEMITACYELSDGRDKAIAVLTVLKKMFRDVLFYGSVSSLSSHESMVEKLYKRISKESAFKLINSCEQLISLANKNCNNNILITKISGDLRAATGK